MAPLRFSLICSTCSTSDLTATIAVAVVVVLVGFDRLDAGYSVSVVFALVVLGMSAVLSSVGAPVVPEAWFVLGAVAAVA